MNGLIPPAAYFKPSAHAREQAELFERSWQLAGFLRDLADENDYLTTQLAGRSVVVQRFSGGLRAFTNVCSHRHSLIRTDTRGNGPLRCAYHGWQYDEQGIPAVIPHKPRFDNMTPERRAGLCLERWEVATCGEFVFVRLRPGGPTLEENLGPVASLVGQIGAALGDRLFVGADVIEANWKIVVENSLEAYHVEFLHEHTFASLGLHQTGVDVSSANTTWSAVWGEKHTQRMESLSRSLYQSRPFSCPGYLHVLLFPNMMLATSFGTSFAVHTVVPLAPGRCEYRSVFFSTKLGAELPLAKAKMRELVEKELVAFNRKVFSEDLGTLGEVQRGVVNAGRVGVLSDEEVRIWKFHDDYMKRFGGRT